MAYIVKPLRGEERRMEKAEILEALKNGVIAENWLVRDERQELFYSVGKLVGKTASEAIPLACPRCKTGIPAKRIDIGLPVACPQCGYTVMVHDPADFERNLRDAALFLEARQKAVLGALAFVAGTFVTVGSYFLATDMVILWWGPIVFGLATFVSTFPRYRELKKRLGPLAVAQVDAPMPRPKETYRGDPRDRY